MARHAVTGTFAATGQSASFVPDVDIDTNLRTFNVSLWGTFVGTVKLERTFDGTNWLVCSKPDLSDASFTGPVTFTGAEAERGISYRLNCSAYTSGTVNYRISQ